MTSQIAEEKDIVSNTKNAIFFKRPPTDFDKIYIF